MRRFQFSALELFLVTTLAACLFAELASGTQTAREELRRSDLIAPNVAAHGDIAR